MNIGEKIKYYRTLNKMTQKTLANNIDKSIESIKKYENGSINPPIDVLQKMAKVLNLNIWELVTDELDFKNSNIDDETQTYIYGLLSNGFFLENTLEHFGYSLESGENHKRFLNTSDNKKIEITKGDLNQIYIALENTINFEIKRILRNNGVDVK